MGFLINLQQMKGNRINSKRQITLIKNIYKKY